MPSYMLLFGVHGSVSWSPARHTPTARCSPIGRNNAVRIRTNRREGQEWLVLGHDRVRMPGEAAATGVDFATRGRRANEAIDALRLLWAGDEDGVSFDGEFFSFADVCSFPKPTGTGSLPVHVGGSSPAAARRAGLRGDGYFQGGRLTPAERASQIEIMRATARDAGRDPDALEYTRWGAIDMTAADVDAHAARGTTRLVVAPASVDLPGQLDQLSAFAARLDL